MGGARSLAQSLSNNPTAQRALSWAGNTPVVQRAGAVATNVGTQAARIAGRAGEAASGVIKNRKSIPSMTGARNRVPDGLNSTTISEVKNRAYQAWTRQLRDFDAFARESRLQFELWLRPDTRVSRPLQDAINRGDVVRRDLPPNVQ